MPHSTQLVDPLCVDAFAQSWLTQIGQCGAGLILMHGGLDKLDTTHVDIVIDVPRSAEEVRVLWSKTLRPSYAARGMGFAVLFRTCDTLDLEDRNFDDAFERNAVERLWGQRTRCLFVCSGGGLAKIVSQPDHVHAIIHARAIAMHTEYARNRREIVYDADLAWGNGCMQIYAAELPSITQARQMSVFKAHVRARNGANPCALSILNRIVWNTGEHWTKAQVRCGLRYLTPGSLTHSSTRLMTESELNAVIGSHSGLFGNNDDPMRHFILVHPTAGYIAAPNTIFTPATRVMRRDATVRDILENVWTMRRELEGPAMRFMGTKIHEMVQGCSALCVTCIM